MSRTLRTMPSAAQLRGRWQRDSGAAGWAFPSDWYTPAVDALCEALSESPCVRGGEQPAATWAARGGEQPGATWAAAERLGGERASAGVSLAETLADVDVVAALMPDRADVLRRATSLGWADGAAAPTDAVLDVLTGLVSAEYLRVRLGEVYRAAEVEGSSAETTHALVVIRLGRVGARSWAQSLPMILVGDAMRTVFAGGQSLARIGPMVAVALTERTPLLGRQARLLAELIAGRVRVGDGPGLLPQVWIECLPPGCSAAHDLLAGLAR